MDDTTITIVIALVTSISQLGVAAAAWRLASKLALRVDNHEGRLGELEKDRGGN